MIHDLYLYGTQSGANDYGGLPNFCHFHLTITLLLFIIITIIIMINIIIIIIIIAKIYIVQQVDCQLDAKSVVHVGTVNQISTENIVFYHKL